MNEASIYLTRAHRARLLNIWRSGGWPHRDALDLDLLAAEAVSRHWSADGRETLRPTDAGITWLMKQRHLARRALSAHDRLAARVAATLMSSGRLVWRELSMRARIDAEPRPAPGASPAPAETTDATEKRTGSPGLWSEQDLDPVVEASTAGAWRMARPDVFSIRNTSVQAYLHPVVHEVKSSRADLLSDLRNPAKREAYRWLCCECYYVFPEGIASVDDIPEAFGIVVCKGSIEEGSLELVRAARHNACTLPFAVWMALAHASPLRTQPEDDAQALL